MFQFYHAKIEYELARLAVPLDQLARRNLQEILNEELDKIDLVFVRTLFELFYKKHLLIKDIDVLYEDVLEGRKEDSCYFLNLGLMGM